MQKLEPKTADLKPTKVEHVDRVNILPDPDPDMTDDSFPSNLIFIILN